MESFDRMASSARISRTELQELLPVGRHTIIRAVKAGRLPKPLRIGRENTWSVAEVRAFIGVKAKGAKS
jgi:predicted DNA-binding transcriptional regulator AlpA